MRKDRRLAAQQRLPRAGDLAAGIVAVARPAVRDAAGGILRQRAHLQFQLARQQQVVAVEVLQQLAARDLPSRLARRAGAAVLAAHAAHFRMPRHQCGDGRGRVVGRRVVDDDDLDGTVALRERALDRFDQHRRAVEHRDDDADQHRCENSATMPAVRSARSLMLAGAAAVLPIAAEFIDKVAVHPRPFWAFDYDPEAIYFYQSLRILDGRAPLNVDHPGVPVQLLGASIALVTGRAPLQFDAFRLAAYAVAFALVIVAAIVLARVLFREASPWLAVAGVWTYFLAPLALERNAIWSAEIVYFPLGVLALVLVTRALRDDAAPRHDVLAGAAVGLCIATKFLFLGWAAALLIVARRRVLAAAGIAAGFLAGTCVAATRYPYMLGWVWQNASHGGAYGRGALAPPDPAATLRAYAAFAVHAKAWLLWIAVIAALLWTSRRALDRRLALFAAVAALLTMALPFRNPTNTRYFLPAGAALVALLAAARAVPRAAAIAACGSAGLLLAKNVVDDVRSHETKIRQQTAL